MDSELVTDSESVQGVGQTGQSALPQKYTSYFEQAAPYYMAWGMTYKEFWEEDCLLVRYYRTAHKIRYEEANTQMWLQGRYIYDALRAVSPIFRAMSKARKPIKYLDKPYPLFEEEKKEATAAVKREQQKSDSKALAVMQSYMMAFNKKFREKGGSVNSGR